MLNYLQFGKEEIIKAEVQPGGTDALHSCAPAQLDLSCLNCLLLLSVKLDFLTLPWALESQKNEF